MSVGEDLNALQLFNEKSAELRASRFFEMARHQNVGINISFGVDLPMTVARTGPDEEAVRAFMLTFRFFIQDNERCSIRKVAAVYDRLDVPEERKKLVAQARADLNAYLDRPTFIQIGVEKAKVTNRRLLDVFLYGTLAHTNEEKQRVLESWRAIPELWPIMYNELVHIVMTCLEIIAWLERTNLQTLEDLNAFLPQMTFPVKPLP
jgi:hypothetical protein